MSGSDVTRNGVKGAVPGRDAMTGVHTGPGASELPERRWRRRNRAEAPMVPEATFSSYYGKPVINRPVWEAPDIPGYLFLGGLAGAGSVIAAGAHLTGRPHLARTLKLGATTAAGLSFAALVHDLGRPARFFNMLRTFKVTSPMSVGSWLLSAYGGAATVAVASDLTGLARPLGLAATLGAAAIGPGVATYTAALIADTAVPAWHEGHRMMPYLFASSAISAAAGLGLVGAPLAETVPVRRLAVLSGAGELVLTKLMERQTGLAKQAYEEGRAKRYAQVAEAATITGVALSIAGRRHRLLSALGGLGLLVGSVSTRFTIFEAGLNSADDPKYTIVPQRERLEARRAAAT